MTTRRELRKTRIQLLKEEGVLRELKRSAALAAATDIQNSEREVEQLREKLKRLKSSV